jgi:predicted phage tail protein
MAELSEEDLGKILGADFREKMAEADLASGMKDGERDKHASVGSMDGKKSLGAYTGALGILMIIASVLTVTGTTLFFQVAFGVTLFVLGAAAFIYFRRAVGIARAELAMAG